MERETASRFIPPNKGNAKRPDMKKLLLLSAALSLSACAETVFNASPSIFPPIEGPITLPSESSGFYQGRSDEFIRQLSDAEQSVWDRMTAEQRVIAAAYIRAGGTLTSALQDEQFGSAVTAHRSLPWYQQLLGGS